MGAKAPEIAAAVLTIRRHLDGLAEAVPPATRRVYWPYWRRVADEWGDRRIDEVTPLEIEQLAERVKADVVVRRNSRGGRSAAEHLICALRCMYRHAVAGGLVTDSSPDRLNDTITAMQQAQPLEDIHSAAVNTSEIVADCDRKLSRYRLALEAGTDPAIITQWTAEVHARRIEAHCSTSHLERNRLLKTDAAWYVDTAR